MTLRKIGGLYWLSLGPFRIAFCKTKRKPLYRHGFRIVN
jgi:hypothetical protein